MTTKRKTAPEPEAAPELLFDPFTPGDRPYVVYVDEIRLPADMMISDIEDFVEAVRQIGNARWMNRSVVVEVRSFSEWDLRGLAEQLAHLVQNYAGSYELAQDKFAWHGPRAVVGGQLLVELQYLVEHGYQPSYNGRPSCPICGAFVDDEETHTKGCALLAAIPKEW